MEYYELVQKMYSLVDQIVRCTDVDQAMRLGKLLDEVNGQLKTMPTPQV